MKNISIYMNISSRMDNYINKRIIYKLTYLYLYDINFSIKPFIFSMEK